MREDWRIMIVAGRSATRIAGDTLLCRLQGRLPTDGFRTLTRRSAFGRSDRLAMAGPTRSVGLPSDRPCSPQRTMSKSQGATRGVLGGIGASLVASECRYHASQDYLWGASGRPAAPGPIGSSASSDRSGEQPEMVANGQAVERPDCAASLRRSGLSHARYGYPDKDGQAHPIRVVVGRLRQFAGLAPAAHGGRPVAMFSRSHRSR